MKRNPLLTVRDLTLIYGKGCPECLDKTGPECNTNICPSCSSVIAMAGVDFDLYPGEIIGVVGESGSGKSTLVQSLYFEKELTRGGIFFDHPSTVGENLADIGSNRKRYIKNHLMGMVNQNPLAGLKMSFTNGANIAEKLLTADCYHFGKIRKRVKELLFKTEVPPDYVDKRPGQLSGGMQQRIQIAKALANDPPLLLLDEVTTGLDLSVQARVLDLIKKLQAESGVTMIVVSHDLGVIRLLTQRTMVLKNGRVVECGLTDQILEDPIHPYSQLLVHSML